MFATIIPIINRAIPKRYLIEYKSTFTLGALQLTDNFDAKQLPSVIKLTVIYYRILRRVTLKGSISMPTIQPTG